MASSQRIHRLLRLVGLLQSGRVYNSRELAELCAVSRRTIFRDIGTLQDSGVQILFNEERQGYTLPAAPLLPATDFTLYETLSLLLVCHELGPRESGLPLDDAARSAAVKLLGTLPHHLRGYVGELTESISVRLQPRSSLDGAQQHYEALMQALSERRAVRLAYQSLAQNEWSEITTLLSPYRLLYIRHAWYVIGRSSLHRSVRTFNVARIRNAELLDTRYEIPKGFNLDRYLGNAWLLIREPGKRYRVRVRFSGLVAQNVTEVRWHKTQQTTRNADGTHDFTVTVDSLKEIVWWILGYGDQAEVLEPRELRDDIRQKIAAMQATYDGAKKPKRDRR